MKKKIAAIIGLVIVLCVALVLPLGTAFADYEDILNDDASIVNFNQVFNCSTWGTTTTVWTNDHFEVTGTSIASGSWLWLGAGSLNSSHRYFLHIEQAYDWCEFVADGAGNHMRGTASFIGYPNSSGDFTMYFRTTHSGDYNHYVVYLYCIDLTLMFGSNDNIPDLLQCLDLFVANWYPYNTGSAVSLSGINAYAEGVQSVYDILTYNYVGEDSYNLLQPYAFYRGAIYYNGAPSKEQSHISVASVDGDGWSSGNGFALYYPFTSSLVAGDTITLNGMLGSATDMGTHQQATTYIIIRYGENIYDVLSVNNIVLQDADTYNIISYTYTLPSDATGLVFYSVQPFRVKDFTIQVRALSVNSLVDSAYRNGIEKGKSYYAPGTSGYYLIYQSGYDAGVVAPTWSFKDLIAAAIDTPIIAMTNLFDFDILGVNMKTFYLSVFTLAVIITIIRLVI